MSFDEQCETQCAKFGISREDLGLMALLWISRSTGDSLMFVAWVDACTQEEVDKVVCPITRAKVSSDAMLDLVNAGPGQNTKALAELAKCTEDEAECILEELYSDDLVHKIEHQQWMPGPGDEDA